MIGAIINFALTKPWTTCTYALTYLYLGVGADVGLVTRVGDAARDVHEAVRVLVLLLPRREPVHATWREKYFLFKHS